MSVSLVAKTCVVLFLSRGSIGSEQHPHTGVLDPFRPGRPGVSLDGHAQQVLSSGEPYKTEIPFDSDKRRMIVQDVQAPTDVVWGRILDFDSYHEMVPQTFESERTKTETLSNGQERIWVKLKAGHPLLKLEINTYHLYDPAENTMTWTLDYNQKSDLDDSTGYWYVVPHPENPLHSRVHYSTDVSISPWIRRFAGDSINKKALGDAVAWVKKHSELKHKELNRGVHQHSVTEVEVSRPKRSFWNLGRNSTNGLVPAAC